MTASNAALLMQFFILALLISLFVFLYCAYSLAKDDFIFLRRDVSMERLFNIIFLGSLACLFGSRLFYGVFYAKGILSNLFVFLLFPYFPGLSLLGGVLGAGAFILFLTRKKDPLPLGRMSDFFSIAFLITLPIGFLGYFMFAESGFPVQRAGSLIAAYFALFVIFLKFLLPRLLGGKLKEGSIALLFLIVFSLISLINNLVGWDGKLFSFKLIPENLILFLMLISSTIFLIRQEDLIGKIKKFRKG